MSKYRIEDGNRYNYIFFTDRKKINNLKSISLLPKNSLVIFREYDFSFDQRLNLGKKIKELCLAKSIKFIVGKDLHLAMELLSDGIHFSDNDNFYLNFLKAKKNCKKNFIISVAFHNQKSLLQNKNLEIDFMFLSPIFPTTSHIDITPIGLLPLVKLSKSYNMNIYPLGGVSYDKITRLRNCNIDTISGIDFLKKN